MTTRPIVVSSFTKEEQAQYAERMLVITEERIAERGLTSRFDSELEALLQQKVHYIVMLNSAELI